MTKARPRRDRSAADIDAVSWRFLCDATTAEDRTEHPWLLHTLEFNEKDLAIASPPTGKSTSELWAEFGDQVISWWIKERPGTRPWCWWRYDAPGPRQRIGGVGITKQAAVGNPEYLPDFQLPASDTWLTGHDARWHPYVGTGAMSFDPADPPTFESQAAYLRRHSLFRPGEQARVPAAAFDLEPIELPLRRSRDQVQAAAGPP